MTFDPVEFLRRLVTIERPSGREEAARDLVAAALESEGIEPRIDGRNVWAEAGPAGAPALLLNSHLDTVRAGSGWTRDPRDPGDDPDRIFGLGANDAGGSGAALLDAFCALAGQDLPARLVLALTCDEETGGEGLEVLRPRLEGLSAAVIGEPTGLRVCTAQRGLMRFEVTVTGRTAHASRPWQGVNAIEGALSDMKRLLAIRFPREHPLLGPATLALTRIEGGTAPNVIPARCVFTGDARPTPLHPNREIVEAIEAAVEIGEITTMKARMTPVETPLEADVVASALEAIDDARVVAFGGVSDLFHVRDLPGIVCGPGQPERSHAPDEWIGVAEVNEAAAAYRRLAWAWMRRVTT